MCINRKMARHVGPTEGCHLYEQPYLTTPHHAYSKRSGRYHKTGFGSRIFEDNTFLQSAMGPTLDVLAPWPLVILDSNCSPKHMTFVRPRLDLKQPIPPLSIGLCPPQLDPILYRFSEGQPHILSYPSRQISTQPFVACYVFDFLSR